MHCRPPIRKFLMSFTDSFSESPQLHDVITMIAISMAALLCYCSPVPLLLCLIKAFQPNSFFRMNSMISSIFPPNALSMPASFSRPYRPRIFFRIMMMINLDIRLSLLISCLFQNRQSTDVLLYIKYFCLFVFFI